MSQVNRPPPPLCIDRCVCHRRTFVELQEVAERSGATTLRALQEQVDFGQTCRLCHPYVREMLRSGRTRFTEILADQDPRGGQAG